MSVAYTVECYGQVAKVGKGEGMDGGKGEGARWGEGAWKICNLVCADCTIVFPCSGQRCKSLQ